LPNSPAEGPVFCGSGTENRHNFGVADGGCLTRTLIGETLRSCTEARRVRANGAHSHRVWFWERNQTRTLLKGQSSNTKTVPTEDKCLQCVKRTGSQNISQQARLSENLFVLGWRVFTNDVDYETLLLRYCLRHSTEVSSLMKSKRWAHRIDTVLEALSGHRGRGGGDGNAIKN